MRHVWSTLLHSLSIPAVVLFGLVATGCGGDGSTSGGGGSGANGGSGGSGGEGGEGGAGGAACKPTTEICDRVDNDCNGQIDDVPGGCACSDGATQPCYSGPDGTAGVGACKQGLQACEDGQWGPCAGEVVPATEACNALDDDCNGVVDDMGQLSCGIGACAVTIDKCISGQPQTCVPGQPGVEVCDGIDNNCNQLVDEFDPMLDALCDSGEPGVCLVGKLACVDHALVCVAQETPSMEVCDGLDNDCNGMADDGIPGTGGTCATGALGVCESGTISCKLAGGVWQIDCFSNVEASQELCDGLDNDCNGTVDDDNPEGGGPCDTGLLGVCQAGTLDCIGGALQCTQNVQPGDEACNGLDDNCDGQIDEGDPGSGQPCGCAGTGITSCENGHLLCNGGPLTYFSEDFSDNSAGWTLGTQWQIGPATSSNGNCDSCPGQDPVQDHSPTADNGVAGQAIGGCTTTALHADYCLTSPAIDLSAAVGNVYLSFWRHLHSDYPSFVTNRVQAFNGTTWVNLWVQPDNSTCINDEEWTTIPGQTQFNVTALKNADFRVRWCSNLGSSGAYAGGGWTIDDVVVASEVCQ